MGMKLDCILDFITAWKEWDIAEDKGNNSESTQPFWNLRLQDAGYYGIESTRE